MNKQLTSTLKRTLVFCVPFVFFGFTSGNTEKEIIAERPLFSGNVNYKLKTSGILGHKDLTVLHVGDIYKDRWDTLSHVGFWRQVMRLSEDTCIVNAASNRKVLGKVAMADWKRQSEAQKDVIKDSLRIQHGFPADEIIYLTSGKSYFYKFNEVIPDIDKAIDIFEEQGVDPFFAQCVLLIESPGRLQKSTVGAYG